MGADEVFVDAPNRTNAADVATLRLRLEDLDHRRIAALGREKTSACPVRLKQLEGMRFELAEVERHLAQLESSLTHYSG